jgi:hypothetical protein
MAEPFAERWLYAEAPIVDLRTTYTKYGDYLGIAFTLAALMLLIMGLISYILGLSKRRKSN